MQATYITRSCSQEPVAVTATLPNDQEVTAMVTGLVVELEAPDGQSITRRYVPEDLEADALLFAVGAEIVVSFDAA